MEKYRWLFRRSLRFPDQGDIYLDVELTPAEMGLVEEIASLEYSQDFIDCRNSGSGPIRNYLRIPYGTSLTQPRDQLIKKFHRNYLYLRYNLETITRNTPSCLPQVNGIMTRLGQLIGENNPSLDPQPASR